MKSFAPVDDYLNGDDSLKRIEDHSYATHDGEEQVDNPERKVKVEAPDVISDIRCAQTPTSTAPHDSYIKTEIKQEQQQQQQQQHVEEESKLNLTLKSEPEPMDDTSMNTVDSTSYWRLLRDIKVEVDDQEQTIDYNIPEDLTVVNCTGHMYRCDRCNLYFDEQHIFMSHCIECERRDLVAMATSTEASDSSRTRLHEWKSLRKKILIEKEKKKKNPLDTFFLSMCETTKNLPVNLQLRVKRQVFQAVVKAEEEAANLNNADDYEGS